MLLALREDWLLGPAVSAQLVAIIRRAVSSPYRSDQFDQSDLQARLFSQSERICLSLLTAGLPVRGRPLRKLA